MYVARILYPVKVLGPGNRIAIWMSGCSHQCRGCSNPELWQQDSRFYITKEKFKDLVHSISDRFLVDGFTLTGGDPFLNPKDLYEILEIITSISNDVIVYTGYKYDKLKNNPNYAKCLDKISVLIDGPYIESLNDNSFLRGSSNQNIILVKDSLKGKYESYIKKGKNEIQNFLTKDGFISVGIHDINYPKNIEKKLQLSSKLT